jgi:SAM-dependent methyltransferase
MQTQSGRSSYHATDGAAYEEFLGRWTRRLAEPLLDFAQFPDAGRLLDAGCGTGALASAMAARWPARPIVGIDIAPPYVAFAKSRTRFANLVFEEGDVAKLPYPDASFAGAAAQLVLNFVPDPVAALKEMRRVTAPGGRLVAAVWDFRGGLVYQRIFWDTAGSMLAPPSRATSCFPGRSRSLRVSFGCSKLPTLIGSSAPPSPVAWITPALTITGSRFAAARDLLALIFRSWLRACGRASKRPSQRPIAPAHPTGRAR